MVHLLHDVHVHQLASDSPTLDHFHRNQWTNSPEYAWRPTFGSTAQKTLAVPQRLYSVSRLAILPGVGRTSPCRVTGFSSRQTTGSAAFKGRSYVARTSSILVM